MLNLRNHGIKATPNRFHVSRIRRVRFLQFATTKKKVGALMRMRTSTNLRRRDAALLEEDIHGDFNDIHAFFFFFFTRHPGHNFRWEIRET